MVSYTSGNFATETIDVIDPPGGKNTTEWHATRYTVQSSGNVYKFSLIDKFGYVGTVFVSDREINGTFEQAIWEKNLVTGQYIEKWVSRGTLVENSTIYDGGKPVYVVEGLFDHKEDKKSTDSPVNESDELNRIYVEQDYGYIVLYGTPLSLQAKQDITVQWQRPEDNEMLETSFQITVSSPPING